MRLLHPNVFILLIAQALIGSSGPLIVFVGGFIGIALAPTPALATLPISCMIVGVALFTLPVVKLMSRIGRKRGILLTTLCGLLCSLFAAFSIEQQSFWLLCFSILLFGIPLAANQQFRFAAIESVAPEQSGQAVSVLLMAGLVAAFVGPELGVWGKSVLNESFSGAFVFLAINMLVALAVISRLQPVGAPSLHQDSAPRPLTQLITQPIFLLALSSAAISFAVMSFIMTATPISMHVHHHFSMQDTKWVIQSHIIAMYLPSLFTALLIRKLGIRKLMLAGVAALLTCVVIGLINQDYVHYWSALVLLGIGWNFMYVAGTTWLPQSYQENEKFRVQGINDLTIFSLQALASLSAGIVIGWFGWNWVLLSTLPLLFLPVLALWHWRRTQSSPSS